MNISPQQFRAYADGELSGEEARAVEEAIAADPVLAARLQKVRRAKGKVRPLHLSTARRAGEDHAALRKGAILDFSAAKARRKQANATSEPRRPGAATKGKVPVFERPGLALGLSLALILGVLIGSSLDLDRFADTSGQDTVGRSVGNIRDAGDRLLATGALARALESSPRTSRRDERLFAVLATYKSDDGTYCRRFAGLIGAGLACRRADAWRLIALDASGRAGPTQPGRQLGEPLSAEAEAEVLSAGWP
ncbi:anti-sigma factor [Novosphingobium sp. BW1]|uniref:anti-sigma factor family protein n=1 Tax=Novosphingobium sp. BW1 TaxID=2592621 RepID=UPI0011DE5ED1|nr:hypothetical protein [Novosphingobium sp. BW1]TYC87766.1 hypothetical protein FMM79_11605 [Novosphingobium sp. BW1]